MSRSIYGYTDEDDKDKLFPPHPDQPAQEVLAKLAEASNVYWSSDGYMRLDQSKPLRFDWWGEASGHAVLSDGVVDHFWQATPSGTLASNLSYTEAFDAVCRIVREPRPKRQPKEIK